MRTRTKAGDEIRVHLVRAPGTLIFAIYDSVEQLDARALLTIDEAQDFVNGILDSIARAKQRLGEEGNKSAQTVKTWRSETSGETFIEVASFECSGRRVVVGKADSDVLDCRFEDKERQKKKES